MLRSVTTIPGNGLTTPRTFRREFYVESPSGSKTFPMAGIPNGARITGVRHKTDTGTVDFNVELRDETTPFTSSTTKLFSSDKQASTTSALETVFTNNLSPGKKLHYVESAVASSPTKVEVVVEGVY